MALINRISRLFKADFHAVLDNVEDPEMLLKQSIREMEDSLAQTALHQRQTQHQLEELRARKNEIDQMLSDIAEELDICFESDEDTLARDLIRRKLHMQRTLLHLTTRIEATEKQSSSQKKQLEDNHTKLESMQQKAELVARREPAMHPHTQAMGKVAWSFRELSVSDNDVEVAFLREKKQRSTS